MKKIIKTDAEWKAQLSAEEYYVARQKGTERPFTGRFWDHNEHGIYRAAAGQAILWRLMATMCAKKPTIRTA